MGWIKRNAGEVLLILGAGVFAYNVFGISHYHEIVPGSRYYVDAWYGYNSSRLFGIALGVALCVTALLVFRNNKKSN
jgi:hypothetical protein